MIPPEEPHDKIVITPDNLEDMDIMPPIEVVAMGDGYHARIILDPGDIEDLIARPYIHIVFHSKQVPMFMIATELDAVRKSQ